jgi:epoxyqueuosine reductase
MNDLNTKVRALAAEHGFDDCRIARAKRATHADEFEAWIADGHHGDMQWLERNPNRRCDPREVLPGCKAVICLAVNYYTGDEPFPDDHPRNYKIAKYAWNDDYHDLLENRLARFNAALVELGGTQRYYVDTGPVLERDFATDSGLGWNGKSTNNSRTLR